MKLLQPKELKTKVSIQPEMNSMPLQVMRPLLQEEVKLALDQQVGLQAHQEMYIMTNRFSYYLLIIFFKFYKTACDICGKLFKGTAGVKIHKARMHKH